MNTGLHLPRRQRGVALLTAVLAVALAVVLVAALLDRGEAARQRTAHLTRGEQSWQLLAGVEGWALRALADEEAQQPGVDAAGDAWSQPLPPVEVPGGRVSGSVRELGGCFNLNALDSDHRDAMRQRFERLLRALALDPGIAAAAQDWVDADGNATPGGAEDAQYRVATPPYRAANRPFAHVSELRLVRGVDADAFDRLRPHVCALPDPMQPMNMNTASPELWMSLDERITAGMARRLWRNGSARYENATRLQEELARELNLPAEPLPPLPLLTGVSSRYFVIEADILADGLPFLYSSLLERDGGSGRVLARVRGRW